MNKTMTDEQDDVTLSCSDCGRELTPDNCRDMQSRQCDDCADFQFATLAEREQEEEEEL